MRETISRITATAVLILSLAGLPAQGSQQICAVAFDDGEGIVIIAAPQGWEFDRKSPRAPDVHALIYPGGAPRTETTTSMYVKTVPKKGYASLAGLVSKEVEDRKAALPGLKVVTGDPVTTVRDHQQAQVRHFSSAKAGSFESAAYIEGSGVYVVIVLSAKSEAAQEEAQRAFLESVQSFHGSTLRGGIYRPK